MDPIVHFEMPYKKDEKRMAKYYLSTFGWQTRMLGEKRGKYVWIRIFSRRRGRV